MPARLNLELAPCPVGFPILIQWVCAAAIRIYAAPVRAQVRRESSAYAGRVLPKILFEPRGELLVGASHA